MRTVCSTCLFRIAGALTAALFGLLMLAVGPAASAAVPTRNLVQPAGATFAAAFPSAPHERVGDAALAKEFPGATSVSAYYVSPDTGDIFAESAPVPRTPTYMVVTAAFGSPEVAQAYVGAMGRIPGMKPVLVGNIAGYHLLSRETGPINKGNKVTQPHAFESVLAVASGNSAYVAFAFTQQAGPARAFTGSLQPLGGQSPAGAAVPGQSVPLTVSPAQSLGVHGSSTAYRDGKYVAYALVALLVVAIVVKYGRPSRPSSGPYRGPANYGGPPATGDPAAPNSQFAWMYQGAPAPTEPPAGAPPVDPTLWPPPNPDTR